MPRCAVPVEAFSLQLNAPSCLCVQGWRTEAFKNGGCRPVTFLVLWRIELALLSSHLLRAVLQMGDYSASAQRSGMISGRYNVVGAHGGAWLCEVASNEELERLLARAPIYNFAHIRAVPQRCGLPDQVGRLPPAIS